jgi:hypothetical protein
MEMKAGTRVKCATCGAELIALRPLDPELSCCGQPLLPPPSAKA